MKFYKATQLGYKEEQDGNLLKLKMDFV